MSRTSYRAHIGVIMVSALLIAGCTKPPAVVDGPGPTGAVTDAALSASDPQWVHQGTPHARVAIIYVHGIFGDTLGTWKNTNGASFFDFIAKDPRVGSAVDQYAFGYTSKMVGGGSFDINEAAKRLYQSLDDAGVLQYPAIVFVAHSMGGLVTMRLQLLHRELMPRTALIALYATPQDGAQVAAIGKALLTNPALKEMIPADANAYLQTLDDDWRQAIREHPIPVVCAYEKKSIYGIPIVERSSATRYCTEPANAVDADHLSIVKPDRPQHDSVVILTNALRHHVVGQEFAGRLDAPDFVRDGGAWRYTLKAPFGPHTARLFNVGQRSLVYVITPASDPGLIVWPTDRRTVAPNNGSDLLYLALGFQASRTQYQFALHVDDQPDQTVIVTVPDLPQQLAQQQQLTVKMGNDLNLWLSSNDERQRLEARAANDPTVAAAVIERARQSVATTLGAAPPAVQWILTADALNAVNWPNFAVGALREAERASPAIVRTAAAQRSAAIAARGSGETRVFAQAVTPADPAIGTDWNADATLSQWSTDVAGALSLKFRGIPALRSAGLSLQGDVARLHGDAAAAHQAYTDAVQLRPTPSLTDRLKATAAMTAPAGPAIAAPPPIANPKTQIVKQKPTGGIAGKVARTPATTVVHPPP